MVSLTLKVGQEWAFIFSVSFWEVLLGQVSYIQGGHSRFGLGLWGELYVKISEMEKQMIFL